MGCQEISFGFFLRFPLLGVEKYNTRTSLWNFRGRARKKTTLEKVDASHTVANRCRNIPIALLMSRVNFESIPLKLARMGLWRTGAHQSSIVTPRRLVY